MVEKISMFHVFEKYFILQTLSTTRARNPTYVANAQTVGEKRRVERAHGRAHGPEIEQVCRV